MLRSTFFHVTDDGEHELLTFQSEDVLEGIPPGAPVARRPARCVKTALAGRGQINRMAGVWAPEWIPACLILYHSQQVHVTTRRGDRAVAFSVVFSNNEGYPHGLPGHIMDFFSVNNVPMHYEWDGSRAHSRIDRVAQSAQGLAGEEPVVEDSLLAFIESLGVY